YMNTKRVRRGYYEVFPELMVEEPKNTADNFILEAFTQRLEKEIKTEPITWLWSHRRWKHKR
ncbi:MAG: lipid A biosynthesis acyltransferase, partial [Cytophagales bacterium]